MILLQFNTVAISQRRFKECDHTEIGIKREDFAEFCKDYELLLAEFGYVKTKTNGDD